MKAKKFLCLALASLMCLSFAGLAACGDKSGDDKGDDKNNTQQGGSGNEGSGNEGSGDEGGGEGGGTIVEGQFTLTAGYDEDLGSVTFSAPAGGGEKYAADEKVTATITPNEGCSIGSVSVAGTLVEPKEGKVEIVVKSDTKLLVLFRQDEPAELSYPKDPKYENLSGGTDKNGSTKAHDPVVVEAHRLTAKGALRTSYYAFSTDNDAGYGVQVRSSSDLANWKFEGAAIEGFSKADGSVLGEDDVKALYNDTSFHMYSVYDWIRKGSSWGSGCWTLWAPDVVPAASNPQALEDGGWWMYSCWTTGFGSMRSVIFKLTANNVTGPYTFEKVIVRDADERGPGGGINEIDPSIFYSADGSQMFLSYGSFGGANGGFGIIELDPATGLRKNASEADTVAGKKIVSDAHFDAEGSTIAYYERDVYNGNIATEAYDESKWETKGNYVMMGSDGNLSKNYVMRTWECETPDGTYTSGRNAAGIQVAGNWTWRHEGDPVNITTKALNYYIPGHNDMITTSDGRNLIVYHTRVSESGDGYESGEHFLYSSLIDFNSKGQLVINPNRYAGERVCEVTGDDLLSKTEGKYSVVQMTSSDVAYETKRPVSYAQDCTFKADGTITGAVTGNWKMYGSHYIYIKIGADEYYGTVMPAWVRQYKGSKVIGNAGLTISALTDVATNGENKIIYFNMQF